MKTTLLSLILIVLTGLSPLRSQVTIGSDLEPRSGLLLEIKEDNNTGKNSSGGFGLPRVSLNSLTDFTADNTSTDKTEYTGLTVYNMNTDPQKGLTEGIYTWDGYKWNHVVSVSEYGEDGQTLISRGNGTYGWSTFILPTYSFHKPTQISTIKDGTKNQFTYSYVNVGNSLNSNDYIYRHVLNLQSNSTSMSYLLMGLTVRSFKATYKSGVPLVDYWEKIKVEVVLQNNATNEERVIKEYIRTVSTAAGGSGGVYLDLFSAIPLEGLTSKNYKLKIRAGVIDNNFSRNAPVYPQPIKEGHFSPNAQQFLTMSIEDVNYILYEGG